MSPAYRTAIHLSNDFGMRRSEIVNPCICWLFKWRRGEGFPYAFGRNTERPRLVYYVPARFLAAGRWRRLLSAAPALFQRARKCSAAATERRSRAPPSRRVLLVHRDYLDGPSYRSKRVSGTGSTPPHGRGCRDGRANAGAVGLDGADMDDWLKRWSGYSRINGRRAWIETAQDKPRGRR